MAGTVGDGAPHEITAQTWRRAAAKSPPFGPELIKRQIIQSGE